MLCTEITKGHLNNCICQCCGVKTSTVAPSFYYSILDGSANDPGQQMYGVRGVSLK